MNTPEYRKAYTQIATNNNNKNLATQQHNNI